MSKSAMKVPLLDLSAQNRPLRAEVMRAIQRVVDTDQFILGQESESFERTLAHRLECAHVVGTSSGTDALLLALMALGVGPGDTVVTTPFSFFATAGVISRLGAKPLFADIEPNSFNLDPIAAAAACRADTRAVLPVHLFGRPARLPTVHVPIVEDAAQSIGSQRLGGLAGCLSFFPSKNMGAFGDAGAIYSDDHDFADRCALLRSHGGRPKYYHQAIGGNFRIDALQAAVLSVKLPHLDRWIAGRRQNAERYRRLFRSVSVPDELRLPDDVPGHVYNQFVIRAPRRDALRDYLRNEGIGTEVYYPVPFHLQPCFADLGYKPGSFPQAESAALECLALPIFPELAEQQQAYVVEKVAEFYRSV